MSKETSEIFIHHKQKTGMHTLNGMLNQSNLEFQKRTILFDAVRNHTDLVKTKQFYPIDDISEVEFEVDIVLLSLERYKELIELENNSKLDTYGI